MKDTKLEQLFWLFIAFIFTGFMIYFVTDSGTVSAIAAAFTSIVGIFIGLDIAVMIKKTSAMHDDFKQMNKQRYIVAFIIFALLLIEAFFISAFFGRNCDALYTSFGLGFLFVIGAIFNGIESNKIVTNVKPPIADNEKEQTPPGIESPNT